MARGRAPALPSSLASGTSVFHSIGSCSFFEPVEELEALGMLPCMTGGVGFGVFSVGGDSPRVGFRVGHDVLDLAAHGLGAVFDAPTLNPFLALGRSSLGGHASRASTRLVHAGADLVPLEDATSAFRSRSRDYVDFYSSLEHATNLGRLFRPDAEPLLPNWRHLPVGYHGRAGTVVVERDADRAPVRPGEAADRGRPRFGPSAAARHRARARLRRRGRRAGSASRCHGEAFRDHVFGVVLVNDWSARDIQAWEYQPLGPVPRKVVRDVRSGRGSRRSRCSRTGSCRLRSRIPNRCRTFGRRATGRSTSSSRSSSAGTVVSRTNARGLYWTMPQQLAHATVNGASIATGDLFASGTISGPDARERGLAHRAHAER